ncbi:MAG: Asd/ArgC dimerization domain-containing protein, partial [Thermoplasmatota archaeon]
DEPDRPQPRKDRSEGNYMSVVVGRIRPDPVFDVKFVCLGSNTVRGAAGASILNAELARARGLL